MSVKERKFQIKLWLGAVLISLVTYLVISLIFENVNLIILLILLIFCFFINFLISKTFSNKR